MEIGYSLGAHGGHANATAAHVRACRGSADVYVYICRKKRGKEIRKEHVGYVLCVIQCSICAAKATYT